MRSENRSTLPILTLLLRTDSEAQEFYLDRERWETAKDAARPFLTLLLRSDSWETAKDAARRARGNPALRFEEIADAR